MKKKRCLTYIYPKKPRENIISLRKEAVTRQLRENVGETNNQKLKETKQEKTAQLLTCPLRRFIYDTLVKYK